MKAIIASIALPWAMVGNAGPFGYEMGQKIEGEPDEQTDDGEYVRRIYHDVPLPFTELSLQYTPNAGLCRLFASIDADDCEAQFRRIRRRLTDKYGEPSYDVAADAQWHNVNVDNIDGILLMSGFRVVLAMYVFTNYDDCEAEAAAMRQNDGLQQVL